MDVWKTIALITMGFAIAELIVILLFRNQLGDSNEINIKRQVQKNRRSQNNKQEYNSEIDNKQDKKGIFKRLKKRKNGSN